jgi:Flp pilus assembly pilin Flp
MLTFIKDESGATAIEYGVISSFMAGLIIFSWTMVYDDIAIAFDTLTSAISLA